MRSRPRGWVARNVVDGLVVLAVLIGTVWLVPRGLVGGRGQPAPPPVTVPPVAAPSVTSTATSTGASTTSAPALSTPTGQRRSAVVGKVRVAGFAEGLTFGAGSLWVASGSRLARVDPASDRVLATIPVAPSDSGPAGVSFGAGAVWVPVAVPGSVWRVDPATNKVVAKIPLGESLAGFIGVSATDNAVWLSSGEQQDGQRGGILIRIDPRRNRVTARVPLPGVPSDVAATGDAVWVAMTTGLVLVIEPGRGRAIGAVDTGGPLGFTQTIALGAGAVWLADPLARVVLRVDPASKRVVARIPAGPVTALTVGSGAVWAVGTAGILRIDPARDQVTAMLPAAEVDGVLMVTTGAGWLWAGSADQVARVDPKLVSA